MDTAAAASGKKDEGLASRTWWNLIAAEELSVLAAQALQKNIMANRKEQKNLRAILGTTSIENE